MSEPVYQQIEGHEREDFAGESIVMHRLTHRAVLLNPAAAALWEALRWPQTVADLVGLLREAQPHESEEALRRHVDDALGRLLDAGLLVSFEAGQGPSGGA